MTNEEKALEIKHNDPCCVWNAGCPNVYNAALEMAKWKDEQFNEEKKELFSLVEMLPVDEHNQTIIEDLTELLMI
jgi:hypothetical protein